MNRSTSTTSREVIAPLYTALIGTYLFYCDQFWCLKRRKTWKNERGFSEGP